MTKCFLTKPWPWLASQDSYDPGSLHGGTQWQRLLEKHGTRRLDDIWIWSKEMGKLRGSVVKWEAKDLQPKYSRMIFFWSESKLENPTFMIFLESKGNTSLSCCGVQSPMAGSFGHVKWWDPFATPTQCHAQINKPVAVNLRYTLEIVFYTI